MRNYKLIKYDEVILKKLGFFENYPTNMQKTYRYKSPWGNIKFVIAKGKTYVYFFNIRYLLPCELKDEIGVKEEKSLLKVMEKDLKILKESGIIK
jgi:hypothetical protein